MMAESYESSATLFTTIMIENILSVKLFPYFPDRKSILINNTGFIDKNAFLFTNYAHKTLSTAGLLLLPFPLL